MSRPGAHRPKAKAPTALPEDGLWTLTALPAGRDQSASVSFTAQHTQPLSGRTRTLGTPGASRASFVTVTDTQVTKIDMPVPEPLQTVPIPGRVVDAAGRGVPGISVSLHDIADPGGRAASARVDADGRFAIEGFVGRHYAKRSVMRSVRCSTGTTRSYRCGERRRVASDSA